jgi:hypothetical protein
MFVDEASAVVGGRQVLQDGGGYDHDTEERAGNLSDENVGTITTSDRDTVTVQSRFVTNGTSASGYRTYSTQVVGTLWYAWNRGLGGILFPSSDRAISGWAAGLTDPNITVGYDFGVYDSSGVNRIPEGSTIAQGTQVMLKFSPYVSDNIFWFGTGYSMDSPYGEWRTNAEAPSRQSGKVTCDSKDLTQQYQLSSSIGVNGFDVYIPFSVNPPSRALSNLEGLSCGSLTQNSDGSQSALCTAIQAGNVAPTFNYDATYGKFYYRYSDQREMNYTGWGGPGCYGNNIPMIDFHGSADSLAGNFDTTIQPPYIANIPKQSFPYPLTIGTTTNNPPSVPTLTCPSEVSVGQDITVSLVASDPEGNQIRYGIGWYSSATPDSGWTALMSSGANGSLTKIGGYSSVGAYTVYGWAQDTSSANSAPSSCVINVTSPSTLKICQNSCNSGATRGTTTSTGSFTLVQGGTQNLVACFNSAPGCTDPNGDVTGTATWNENTGSNVVNLSGNAPKTVTAGTAGNENISVSYNGQTANTQATVTCVPTYTQSSCATHPEAQNHCQNEGFTIPDNGCGVPVNCTGGTKTCDFNWKEVAP